LLVYLEACMYRLKIRGRKQQGCTIENGGEVFRKEKIMRIRFSSHAHIQPTQ
jgi:hypothetical protein